MMDGGFDNPKGKVNKMNENEKQSKDIIIPLLNRWIL